MKDEVSEKYPKGASFILWNMFFDRFSAGGFFCEFLKTFFDQGKENLD
jgi:hypothetical protein